MTRHEFLNKIAFILAKENAEALFDYMIHSMDDNGGFLRSRYCYWEKTLPDREYNINPKTVLVALHEPFDFTSTDYYIHENEWENPLTVLKMQLFFVDVSDKEKFLDEAIWNKGVGFPYLIKVDVLNGTYEKVF